MSMRCRSDDECDPGMCCSKYGYCGDTESYCAEKDPCERDADCPESGQCCSNANACVYDTYFCTNEDAEAFASIDDEAPTPTYVPSTAPSSDRTNSTLASASSSSVPTNVSVPTNWPSGSPSTALSDQPSVGPSVSPLGGPTTSPSNSPSFSPTGSASPSSSPSAPPTGTKVPRTLPLPGGGKVTECVSPHDDVEDDAAAAPAAVWQDLLAVHVDFRYIINVNEDVDLSTTLRSLEDVMHDRLVAAKLECKMVRRRNRSLRMLTHNRPMAISTLNDDALNSDVTCNEYQAVDGLDCLVVDGGITTYYEHDVTEVEVRTEYLRFVRDVIEEEGLFNGVDGVESAAFTLSPDENVGGETTQNDVGAGGFETVRASPDGDDETLSGGIIAMIVVLCVLAVILLYITIRYKLYPMWMQKKGAKSAVKNDDDVDRKDKEAASSCAGSAGDDHTLDCLNCTGEGSFTGGSAAAPQQPENALQQSEKTLLRSNTTEAKAVVLGEDVVLSDEYTENDDDESTPTPTTSAAPFGGSIIREHEHVCDDPNLCLVCASQNRPRSREQPALQEARDGQVEFEPVYETRDGDSDDDEDAATDSSDILRQDIQRIYEVDDTVDL